MTITHAKLVLLLQITNQYSYSLCYCNNGSPFSTMSWVNTAHARNIGPWRAILRVLPTREQTGPCFGFRVHLQKDKCPKMVLDLTFLGNEIVLFKRLQYNQCDSVTDSKAFLEEPILHHASATPVLDVPRDLRRSRSHPEMETKTWRRWRVEVGGSIIHDPWWWVEEYLRKWHAMAKVHEIHASS